MRRWPLLALVWLALPSGADAGTYDVAACGGPAGAAQRAFVATADLLMEAYSICPPQNGVGTGIATKASSRGGIARYGAGAYQVFEAPPGASLQSVSFNVGAIRLHDFWSVGLVAYDGDFNSGDLPYGCYYGRPGCGVGTSTFSIPVSVPLYGHGRFRFETRCFNPAGCPTTASPFDPANRALFSAANVIVRVQDQTLPWIGPHHGELWSDGWHRGHQEAWAHFADNVGIMSTRIYADGALEQIVDFRDLSLPEWARCDFTLRKPCKDFDPSGLSLDTSRLADGEHSMRVEAVDAAGNVASIDHQIRVDNTPPAKASGVRIEGGEGWRSGNDYTVRWSNPPGQVAPITAAHYELCGNGSCTGGRVPGNDNIDGLSQLAVPAPGEYSLRVWVEDAAGNADVDRASDPVHLRFDDEPPSAVFERQDPERPTRVAVALGERGSGIAEAGIEIRSEGGRQWQELNTSLDGAIASGEVDDLGLPDGRYELRAHARDQAGNERTSDRRRDGSKMELRLPVRLASGIALSHGARPRCVRRGRHRTRRCRPPAGAGATLIVKRHRARVTGLVRTARGQPIAGVSLSVAQQLRTGGAWGALPPVTSDAVGRFTFAAPEGPSRTVRFRYAGTPRVKPAVGELRMMVSARSAIAVDRRSVRNGDAIRFTGRLRGGHVPEGGKLIDLQAYYRGTWRTFAAPRTDARGRWSYGYRFGATRGTVRYQFRARIRREAAYPYELGYSRRVSVTVRG